MDSIDPTDLLQLLPPEWAAVLAAWAPRVIAYLVLATALVRVLLPLARRLETWAIASSVTWDDGPARTLVVVLEWIARAIRAALSWLPIVARAKEPSSGTVTATPGPRVRRSPTVLEIDTSDRRGPPDPPLDGAAALALVVVAAALSLAASGCSSGPQLPVVTTPITITCSWTNADGGTLEDCDCMVDRSSAQGEGSPVGIDTRGTRVDPTTSVSVPVAGGSGGQ